MLIGGLEKFSLIDYPEHLSAIVFTKGCNFRCQFCYNPMLVWPESQDGLNKISSSNKEETKGRSFELAVSGQVREGDLFSFLESRVGKLDAVVVTGGEPTLHSDLPEFIQKIRDLGFKVKLDTNGTNPEILKSLINERKINYVAMDIKGPLDKYDLAAGVQVEIDKIKESILLIKKSGIPYEFRTTMVPDLHNENAVKKMGEAISGARKWFLQNFISETDLVNKSFRNARVFKDGEMERMKKIAEKYVDFCDVR